MIGAHRALSYLSLGSAQIGGFPSWYKKQQKIAQNALHCTAVHTFYYRLQTGLDVLFSTKKINIQHSTLKTDIDYYPSPRNFPEMSTVSLSRIFPEISGATAVYPVGGSVRLRASTRAGAFVSPARAVYTTKPGRDRKPVSIDQSIGT